MIFLTPIFHLIDWLNTSFKGVQPIYLFQRTIKKKVKWIRKVFLEWKKVAKMWHKSKKRLIVLVEIYLEGIDKTKIAFQCNTEMAFKKKTSIFLV